MTNNQLHGKRFEDFIKGCGLFPGSSDSGRSVTADFDIEAKFDRILGLPTSVKSSGSDGIGLSDARRFFAIDQDFRMLVGRYKQAQGTKVFAAVHEFMVTQKVLTILRGELTPMQIADFHNGLLLSNFPQGAHVAARKWAKLQKALLSGIPSKIILNPKIDSKTQRRLQCSVRLTDLIDACEKVGEYTLHTQSIGNFVLPIIQNSKPRFAHSSPS